MNQDDFKKILDEALEPIKQKQESQSATLESHSAALVSHSAALTNITTKLESHSAALVSIEGKLDAYGDMYKINDSNVRKVEKRLEVLEENAKITPPPELTLADVA